MYSWIINENFLLDIIALLIFGEQIEWTSEEKHNFQKYLFVDKLLEVNDLLRS